MTKLGRPKKTERARPTTVLTLRLPAHVHKDLEKIEELFEQPGELSGRRATAVRAAISFAATHSTLFAQFRSKV